MVIVTEMFFLNMFCARYTRIAINHFKPEFSIVIFMHYNSRLVVDEDDWKWLADEKKILLFFKTIQRKLWLSNH